MVYEAFRVDVAGILAAVAVVYQEAEGSAVSVVVADLVLDTAEARLGTDAEGIPGKREWTQRKKRKGLVFCHPTTSSLLLVWQVCLPGGAKVERLESAVEPGGVLQAAVRGQARIGALQLGHPDVPHPAEGVDWGQVEGEGGNSGGEQPAAFGLDLDVNLRKKNVRKNMCNQIKFLHV